MKITKILLTLLCLLALVFSLASCDTTTTNPAEDLGPWKNATYRSDKSFGEGAVTFMLDVKVGENSVRFTVSTDEETVGAALLAHGLIDGEEGAYGLYVKKVNGITADYDVDGSYWAFYIDGEYAMTGVDSTIVAAGGRYELRYEK